MNIIILKNGGLKITANNEDRKDIGRAYRNGGYPQAEGMVMALLPDNWSFVLPENIGALTDAPIICDDLSIDDAGTVISVGDVWWFPNYMVEDPWKTLKNTGRVIFEPEENNKTLPKS